MDVVDLADEKRWPVEKLKSELAARGFPAPQLQLDKAPSVQLMSKRWLEALPKKHRSPLATDFPAPRDLFILAVDALFGPYPCSAGLRLKASRLMAQVDLPYAVTVLKNACSYTEKSARTTLLTLEAGSRPVLSEHANALADAYRVEPSWLWKETPAPSFLEPLEALAAQAARGSRIRLPSVVPSYTPAWLRPWVEAVQVAVTMVSIVDLDHLMTEEVFASDMITSFMTDHRGQMESNLGRWCWLIYYPMVHPLLIRAYQLDAGVTEDWEPPGVAGAARREREAANLAAAPARRARKEARKQMPKDSKKR